FTHDSVETQPLRYHELRSGRALQCEFVGKREIPFSSGNRVYGFASSAGPIIGRVLSSGESQTIQLCDLDTARVDTMCIVASQSGPALSEADKCEQTRSSTQEGPVMELYTLA